MQVKAKKSLGQNFLKDGAVLERIVSNASVVSTDWVVEIGPGTGALTRLLSEKAQKVIALELDRDLIPDLLKQFPLSSNVSIVEQDILRTDMAEILRSHGYPEDRMGLSDLSAVRGASEARSKTYNESTASSTGTCDEEVCQIPKSLHYKVVANIPYYITAPIIQYLLQLEASPESIVLMIQKEVAERITAEPGDLSILGVSVQYYADPEFLFTVSKTAFDPVPKVDSAVVRLKPKRKLDKEKDKPFFRVVKAGFSARRKTLANNLASGLHLPKEEVFEKLTNLGFDPNIRAQALSVADWERIIDAF